MTYSSNTIAWNENDAYGYDPDGQLTGTTYSVGQTSGEVGTSTYESTSSDAPAYDPNGNRTSTTDVSTSDETTETDEASAADRLLFDGAYYYTFDAAGNRTAKFSSSSGALDSSATDITIYTWDNRNELTSATHYADWTAYHSTHSPDWQIEYGNDAFGRMVTWTQTIAGGESTSTTENLIYDGGNVALILDGDGNVIQRELDGAATDQAFAAESGATGVINWDLNDAQGTVRDVAQFDSGTDTTSAVDHVFYTDFGQATQTATDSADQTAFTYNGTWLDPATKMNDMGARWYDAVNAVFASQDPAGLPAGTNTERFVGNSPTNFADPSGMDTQADNQALQNYQAGFNAADGDYKQQWHAYTLYLQQLQRNYGAPVGPNHPYPPFDPQFNPPQGVGQLSIAWYSALGEDGLYWVPRLMFTPAPPRGPARTGPTVIPSAWDGGWIVLNDFSFHLSPLNNYVNQINTIEQGNSWYFWSNWFSHVGVAAAYASFILGVSGAEFANTMPLNDIIDLGDWGASSEAGGTEFQGPFDVPDSPAVPPGFEPPAIDGPVSPLFPGPFPD